MEVGSMEEMMEAKARLEADGIEVIGPTEHTIFKSIYFRDPSGHRLELAVNTGTPEMMKKLDDVKWDMLNEWAQTKKAPKHAAWMHDGSYASNPPTQHRKDHAMAHRFGRACVRALEIVIVACLALMAVLVFGNVVLRYAFRLGHCGVRRTLAAALCLADLPGRHPGVGAARAHRV